MYGTIDEEEHAKCLECGKELSGRKDKLFCSPKCKDRYNNCKRIRERKFKDRITHSLYLNHTILSNILKSGQKSFAITDLERIGFKPDILTGFRKDGYGRLERICFDISYRQGENWIFNIRKTDLSCLENLLRGF